MVNNNGIPIEVNKKPFETVYELKNEIPTFEEFMKDYKVDENVNYDDLSGSSVGEVKGYGPCSGWISCNDSRCYGSNACKYNERFFDLKTPCPARDCPNRGPERYWYHHNPSNSSCGSSRDKISDECRIRCPDCFNTTHMRYHSFRCSQHDEEFRSTTASSFILAIELVLNSELPEDVYNKIIKGIRAEHRRNAWI